ncbi:hypothetical protein SB768_08095 [Burkholderia sp. SIMBA_043]|uniref:hypothetical protein n=1 Tax=Burkholderia TaxID=32008 RepID=UPI0011860FBB|nr:hypothetical protein [Burkholderia vietnamiensis]UBI27564.1 hypothetical protein LA325_15390 [Burkholderia vietnamiensis]
MSQQTKEQQIALGQSAKQLIENPAFQEAIRRMEKQFYEEWRKATTAEQRERLYLHISVQRTWFNCLNSILGDGQVSAQAMAAARGNTR